MIKIRTLVFSSVFLLTIASATAQILYLKMSEMGQCSFLYTGNPS